MSQNFDETVCLQSEKREEWIREIREEKLQGIAEGTSSAPRLASSLAELLPRRNECQETHCSLIEQEWVPSNRRAENPGIQKEEDKFRLDSWIQIRETR